MEMGRAKEPHPQPLSKPNVNCPLLAMGVKTQQQTYPQTHQQRLEKRLAIQFSKKGFYSCLTDLGMTFYQWM